MSTGTGIRSRDRPLALSPRPSSTHSPSAGSVLDRELVTEKNDLALFGNLQISSPDNNPRNLPYGVKQQCWENAEKIKGREPDRWRRDFLGNTVFRKLVGCPGCLFHEYDHIIPYSRGGKSTLENCQVLQATVSRSKGNRTEISREELIQRCSYCRVSAYGNVRRGPDTGGCNIQ
ncbi:uncharacterized protein LOC130766938 isoform X5 [Actinidia eriantha]|uniref:uncharacterized protein LOC130766938 isoform X5 n=1 Tax=Actinidia eriantha TaxID=165200 RepID=UPI0025911001|nr:uncharacterized protein LOC130766938 isoform X5 [Actinidia eriantha]